MGDQEEIIKQLKELACKLLDDLRLSYTRLEVFSTPRRHVVFVKDLAGRQADITRIHKGPPASRRLTGRQPHPGCGWFCARQRCAGRVVEVREMGRRSICAVEVHEVGRSSVEVLSEALPGLIAAIKFKPGHALELERFGVLASHSLAAGTLRAAGYSLQYAVCLRAMSTRRAAVLHPGRV